ncbi:hypothetical protein [Algoriphagus resistens]|uniref:hypothetical protein n=1 Tax=Algoriphagus resistens TaxID=1750590 RepID=UPI000716C519|nr:hypothetical protein [Algoriphagus resistens]
MKKQRIAYLLGLVWLLGLSVTCLALSKTDAERPWTAGLEIVQEASIQVSAVLVCSDSPKTPSFAVDWSLWSRFNAQWVSLGYEVKGASDFYLFFKKSLALFDVKETFAHFFYTW